MIRYFLVCSLLVAVPRVFAAASDRTKLENLFIWKMSDELSLNPQEEKRFSDLVRELNGKKAALNEEQRKALSEKDPHKALSLYRQALRAYDHLGEEEVDRMQALLGVPRAVKYLEVKQDLAQRLKSLLVHPAPAKPLPPPKVIEE